jgi:hypothetical protein
LDELKIWRSRRAQAAGTGLEKARVALQEAQLTLGKKLS